MDYNKRNKSDSTQYSQENSIGCIHQNARGCVYISKTKKLMVYRKSEKQPQKILNNKNTKIKQTHVNTHSVRT